MNLEKIKERFFYTYDKNLPLKDMFHNSFYSERDFPLERIEQLRKTKWLKSIEQLQYILYNDVSQLDDIPIMKQIDDFVEETDNFHPNSSLDNELIKVAMKYKPDLENKIIDYDIDLERETAVEIFMFNIYDKAKAFNTPFFKRVARENNQHIQHIHYEIKKMIYSNLTEFPNENVIEFTIQQLNDEYNEKGTLTMIDDLLNSLELPDGWVKLYSENDDGRPYYYNDTTRKTQWDPPLNMIREESNQSTEEYEVDEVDEMNFNYDGDDDDDN